MAHILLVDDDQRVRTVMHRTLADAGYEVGEAADGAIALAAYARRRSDLVITDILMPRKEGLETVRELRALDPAVRIIAMSGGGVCAGRGTQYLALAVLFGAARVLSKPFTGKELLQAVAAVVRAPASDEGVTRHANVTVVEELGGGLPALA